MQCGVLKTSDQGYSRSCILAECLHSISRKGAIAWCIRPGKPARNRLMVKSALIPTVPVPNTDRRTPPTTQRAKASSSLKRENTTYIVKFSIQLHYIIKAVLQLCCGLKGGRIVRIFLPLASTHGLYVPVSHLADCGCVETGWGSTNGMLGIGKQTRLG